MQMQRQVMSDAMATAAAVTADFFSVNAPLKTV
jgi:hypothetical protein